MGRRNDRQIPARPDSRTESHGDVYKRQPLFWPREKRVSLNLGKTGGLVDTLSLIGGIVIIGIKAVQVAKDYFVILTKNL